MSCWRACASSSSANVESPRMLIRSIGSICTATLRRIDPPVQGFGNANETLNNLPSSSPARWKFPAESVVKLPNLSIATKLYLIFALLATVTVALATVAALNARRHAALTDEFRSAFEGAMNVELVNGLIYAVVMESRGIYMSPDIPTAKVYGDGLLVFNDRIGEVVNEWQHAVRSDDEGLFKAFSHRIRQFQEFRRELVRRGVEINPAAGREWGDNDANRSVRKALNEDLTKLSQLYSKRSERTYREIDEGIAHTAWLIALIAVIAMALAGLGALIIARGVARPLARITRITQAVAAGQVERV